MSFLYYLILECVITDTEDRFYILTPIDIILAQKTDANDHVDFLIRKRQFKVLVKYIILVNYNIL